MTHRWLNVTVQKKFYSVQCKEVLQCGSTMMESPTAREWRLQRRWERERAHQAAETAAEKEERLRKHRKRDQERRGAETEEQSEARLQRKPSRWNERFSAETEEEREVTLMKLNDNQRQIGVSGWTWGQTGRMSTERVSQMTEFECRRSTISFWVVQIFKFKLWSSQITKSSMPVVGLYTVLSTLVLVLVWGTSPFTREERFGNIAILVLCQWNVVNVIFTTLWTATQVAANQNQLRKCQYS